MNLLSESTPEPPNGVAKDVGELTHDIMSLVELQFELFRSDCRNALKGLLIPVVLLLVAAIVAAGTVPLVLIGIAEVLVQAGGLFPRCAGRIHLGSGPGTRRVVLSPRNRTRVRAFPRRIDPQHCLDQARFEAAGAREIIATSGSLIFSTTPD